MNSIFDRVNESNVLVWSWLNNPKVHFSFWTLYTLADYGSRIYLLKELLNPIFMGINLVFILLLFYGYSLYVFQFLISRLLKEVIVYALIFLGTLFMVKYFILVFLGREMVLSIYLIKEAMMAVHFIPLAFGFWYARLAFTIEKERRKAKRSKELAELRVDKSMLSPHFLFNYLVGLHQDILLNSSNYLTMIPKLASLIRYGMEHVEKPSNWKLESKALKTFLKINKARFSEDFYLDYHEDFPDREKKKYKVPGLLTINLVDNIFKYGDFRIENDPIRVSLCLYEKEGKFRVSFQIRNKIWQRHVPPSLGLGLSTSKKILEAEFGDKAYLEYQNNEGHFELKLDIYYGESRV